MRKKYIKLWWDEVRRGHALRWPGRLLGAAWSPGLARPLAGPISSEIMVTWRCDARCEMCDYPSRPAEDELTLAEVERIVDELAWLGVAGVSLSGGEPFLRPDLFEIIRMVKDRGLMAQVATNGLLLKRDKAEKLIDSGVDMVTVSIDSPRPEVFAAIRRVPGIYERVIAGIDNLLAARRRSENKPGIIVSTTLGGRTLRDIPALLELCEGLGVDAVTLIPLQEVETVSNSFSEEDHREMIALLRMLLGRKQRGWPILDNSAAYLKWLLARHSGCPSRARCFIPYTDLHIGPHGEIFPCIYYSGMNQPWGSARDSKLGDLWFSRDYQARRLDLSSCRKCSIPCHWEMNLLFRRLALPSRLSRSVFPAS